MPHVMRARGLNAVLCATFIAVIFAVTPTLAAAEGWREARAYWLADDLIAWQAPTGAQVSLHFSPDASLEIGENGVAGGEAFALEPAGTIAGALAQKFPHLAGTPMFRLDEATARRAPDLLRGQLVLSARAGRGRTTTVSLQTAGVLDARFSHDGALGVTFADGAPTIALWAPTAKSISLHLFENSNPLAPARRILPMQRDDASGVWRIEGDPSWDRLYYLFEVEVYVRSTGGIERNFVTDPYSLGLSRDSLRSLIVNLEDDDLKPRGWESLKKPPIDAPEDISIYELHIRDFSISDMTAPAPLRGKFAAFTEARTNGVRRLKRLARAGLTHLHLLPAFDCATIAEDETTWRDAGDLSALPPDSAEQQARLAATLGADGFNWCYDPYHYTTPEGSYATDADGPRRIVEFRDMVAHLNRMGLRVVMDVVYNHTTASGQAARSVLDRIVPDYYHRLDETGAVTTSTCCANTATENAMMEKLMLDSLVTWATAYKVDGFRFDLMGHHSKANIEKAQERLESLNEVDHGVDGRSIYLYGEGWSFGEVAKDARFVQATQANMGKGSGVGTFNDRLRDAVRGGWPFDTGADQVRIQGFASGLYTDPNEVNSGSEDERAELLRVTDWIRSGLAGGLSDYAFITHDGQTTRAGNIDYRGQPTGYASDPQETVNYVAAHDNETLFDNNAYKLPLSTTKADRARMQNLATSIVALAQGVPFFHAGQDMLRSKSMDRNSFNSGDWFNLLDFSMTTNGWARGLPPAEENEKNWDVIGQRLADPRLRVGPDEIKAAAVHFEEMLAIRRSSQLFRMRTGEEVIERLRFHNTGPDQTPGLIVMSIAGDNGEAIVVAFNARPEAAQFNIEGFDGGFALHPVQRKSKDAVVRTARFDPATRAFDAPARTTTVFVRSID